MGRYLRRGGGGLFVRAPAVPQSGGIRENMRESVERHQDGDDITLVIEGRPRPLKGRVVSTFQNSFQFVSGSTEYDLRYADIREIRTAKGASNAPRET